MAKTIETSLTLISTSQAGDKTQKNIPDVNPNATSDKLVGFAQKLNALTTNDYNGAVKITKQELSTNKTAASLVLLPVGDAAEGTEVTFPRSDLVITNDNSAIMLKSTSDGKPFVVSNSAAVAVDFFHMTGEGSNKEYWMMVVLTLGPVNDWCNENGEKAYNLNGDIIMENGGTGAGDLVIALAESDTYTQSNTVTIHVTA